MSHWFHRNPLKATTSANFDQKIDKPTETTKRICSDLKLSRSRLLELIKDPSNSKDTVEIAFTAYLGLLYGLIWEIESSEESARRVGRPDRSRLRNVFVFKWTHSILGRTTHSSADSVYEAANMSINVALWFMKHAAMVSSKDGVSMDEAKIIHTTLRQAAGIFTFVQTEFLPQLSSPPPLASDLDPRVINGYINQCTAEAQEVTVARAAEMKQHANLISALANETTKLFLDAANTLRPLDVALQWIKYLELKSSFYLAYAYNYCGENLLDTDKAGESIRALLEAEKHLKKAIELCEVYNKTKGPSSAIKPNHHSVFQRLTVKIKMTLDKCHRENNLIYHERVAEQVPALDKKATFGLVSPIDFQMPPANPLWTQATYHHMMGIKHDTVNRESDLPPVKETTTENPTNKSKNGSGSGCITQ